jgi:hypothetical protein
VIKGLVLTAGIVVCGHVNVFAESLAVLTSRTDLRCVKPQFTGEACRRLTPPYAGTKLRFWQPVLLVETVKRPGDTAIDEFSGFVGEPLRALAASRMGVSSGDMSSTSSASSDTTAVQMNDAHVFAFPLAGVLSGIIQPGCEGAADLSGTVSYLSEADAVEWRTTAMESQNVMSRISETLAPACDIDPSAAPGMCMGVWGPLYPRGGAIAGASAPVGSAAAAYRAVNIASLNMISMHEREIPAMFFPDMSSDLMQMVYPRATQCLSIGEDPRFWADDAVSSDGKYVWIYWRRKECCFL